MRDGDLDLLWPAKLSRQFRGVQTLRVLPLGLLVLRERSMRPLCQGAWLLSDYSNRALPLTALSRSGPGRRMLKLTCGIGLAVESPSCSPTVPRRLIGYYRANSLISRPSRIGAPW